MFLQVTNITTWAPVFFTAIPYSGPQVQVTGPASNSLVSGTITLHTTISDLSGSTNEQFEVDVDMAPTRTSIVNGNTITLDTHYNIAGRGDVNVNAASIPLPCVLTSPPINAKLIFTGSGSLPLNFTNATYLWSASDMCSPGVGTNYITFGIQTPTSFSARITNPSNNVTMKLYSGSVPAGYTGVSIPWNFTDQNNNAYGNDYYGVSLSASGTTVAITNKIDRVGVRTAAGNILTYEQEDPGTTDGTYLNSEDDRWVQSLAIGLYDALYSSDFASQMGYDVSQIGPNRDNPNGYTMPLELVRGGEQSWVNALASDLTNLLFSDFGYYAGHANGVGMGGGPSGSTWITAWIDSGSIKSFAQKPLPNWRMRKVAMWACYTTSPAFTTAGGTYPTWPNALGIRPASQQNAAWMHKNVGLFFQSELPQRGYSGTFGGTSAEVADNFDLLWVGGPTAFPGSADPTYSFFWVYRRILGMSPQIVNGVPVIEGFGYLPYTGIYDTELMTNYTGHVSNPP